MTEEAPASLRSPVAALVVERILGFILSRAIYVVAKLGIADLLANGPLPVEELAARSGAHAPSLHRFLRSLASVGMFTETEPRCFGLTEQSELLRADAPRSLRDLALYYGEVSYLAWEEALYSVRTGRPAAERVFGMTVWDYFGQHPEAAAAFNGAMRQGAAARSVALREYGWRGTETVVDLAGGDGTLLIDLLSHHRGLSGVVVDLPHVADEAVTRIAEAGLAARCEAVPGDLLEHIPPDGDAYVLSIVLHDWDDARAAAILRKCRDTMRDDAVLLLIEIVLPDENIPGLGTFIDLQMLVEPGGRERTEHEWRALIESAGLRLTRIIPREPWSILEAVPEAGLRPTP